MLYYATAGLAVGFINWNGSLGGNCVGCTPFLGSSTHAQLGYVAGGGFERLIGASYAARMEFLYYDLRYENFVLRDVFNPGPYATMRVHPYGAIVRAAFNYRF
jgi:opacity protein-like surface antigen